GPVLPWTLNNLHPPLRMPRRCIRPNTSSNPGGIRLDIFAIGDMDHRRALVKTSIQNRRCLFSQRAAPSEKYIVFEVPPEAENPQAGRKHQPQYQAPVGAFSRNSLASPPTSV